MRVLAGLEPRRVFYFFEDITRIPHGSGNMEQISNYLAEFARERNLFCIQDAVKNIVIVKEATHGYEEEPAIILQGHMDMVAVKEPDCNIDMLTEGLKVAVHGDNIYAEGTSLGGDNGIALAYALAILDSEELQHPRLEVILTADEETGLNGAKDIDLSMLTGHRLLNLDMDEEGIFIVGCAGGARVDCRFKVSRERLNGTAWEVKVCGMQGGHSGSEIHKERGNSNALMGRFLWELAERTAFGLEKLEGGLADNAIARQTTAVLVLEETDRKVLERALKEMEEQWKDELAVKDPDVRIEAKELGPQKLCCVVPEHSKRIAAFLNALPNGVMAMSTEFPRLVETSLNMGLVALEGDALTVGFSVRSSVESAKQGLIGRLSAVTSLVGGSINVRGEYPGWQYRADSPLRDKMVALYEKMYGRNPQVEAVHAGLECGVLGSKINDLDCVSIGPNMKNVHTTEETVSISSTASMWEYLVRLLAEKDS